MNSNGTRSATVDLCPRQTLAEKGLSLAIHSMAELLGLALEEAWRQKLQTLDAAQLEQLAEHLRRKHCWPE